MTFDIIAIPAFKDNYIWAWFEVESQQAWVVDPGDAQPVMTVLDEKQCNLAGILLTHHHHDHSGGVAELVSHWKNIPVYASHKSTVPEVTKHLRENDEIICGKNAFKVLEIPGHTLDHIAFYNEKVLFCGDTLFSAGCGRVFEGTPVQMYESLSKLMQLADDTLVYCAHEYTAANLAFAQWVEPQNPFIQAKLNAVTQLRNANKPSLPSVLREEKQFNPFLRCKTPDVIQAAEARADQHPLAEIEVFSTLRSWKNSI